jgi:hypothetical protein
MRAIGFGKKGITHGAALATTAVESLTFFGDGDILPAEMATRCAWFELSLPSESAHRLGIINAGLSSSRHAN